MTTETQQMTEKNDDLISTSFLSGSSFLKRILQYTPVSKSLEKSQELYNKAKKSNKLVGYSMDKVENSFTKLIESPLVKYVDKSLNLIEDKFAVNEKGNKVLDIVEEKTEKIVESSFSYYSQGKDIVEHKTEQVVDLYYWGKNFVQYKKDNIIELGHEIYENKKEQILSLYTNGKNSLETKKSELTGEYQHRIAEYNKKKDEIKKKGEDIVNSGKTKAVTLLNQTKTQVFDKTQKMIVDILNSKYETINAKYDALKKQYPSLNKIDEYYEKGKHFAEEKRGRVVHLKIEYFDKTQQKVYEAIIEKYQSFLKSPVYIKVDEVYEKGKHYTEEKKEKAIELSKDLYNKALEFVWKNKQQPLLNTLDISSLPPIEEGDHETEKSE